MIPYNRVIAKSKQPEQNHVIIFVQKCWISLNEDGFMEHLILTHELTVSCSNIP